VATLPAAQPAGIREAAVRPIVRPGGFFWLIALALSVVVLWGLVAYAHQVNEGLSVTGLNQRVSWGFYIGNMVFFIGISYGGALTSAILRLTNAPWRAPLTRMAETMAVMALLVGALFPLIDLGRPDRLHYTILHGQVGSPVVWDLIAINTYLVAGLIFLYLPLIPDIAFCRDRLGPAAGRLRQMIYHRLSLGWKGTEKQRRLLEQNMTVMAVLIIPLAVSVHSVLAWLFGVTMRPGWDNTIFGPYFVLGAMFSGVATVILVIAAFRWAYHLEEYIKEIHFKYLANILIALGAGYGYFMFAEYLTKGYKMDGYVHGEGTGALLDAVMLGQYAPLFWLFVIAGLAVPLALTCLPQTRTILWICVASALVVAAMWLKRFLIVVPTMATPIMPEDFAVYWPTQVEVAITLAAAAAIPLMLMLFFRFFPIISIYEMEEVAEAQAHAHHHEPGEATEAEGHEHRHHAEEAGGH
jgi:Ni/Fe-hydrogenase subunit HybB-like protein